MVLTLTYPQHAFIPCELPTIIFQLMQYDMFPFSIVYQEPNTVGITNEQWLLQFHIDSISERFGSYQERAQAQELNHQLLVCYLTYETCRHILWFL